MNKKLSFLFCILFLFALNQDTTKAQVHFVPNPDTCSIFNTVASHQFPPLSSDMPFETLVSWVILDSLCRHANYGDFLDWASTTTQDTLRQALKYFYRLQDYDPLLLDQYSMEVHEKFLPPETLYFGLREIYENRFGLLSLGLRYLLQSDYVIHGRVVSQTSWIEYFRSTRTSGEIFCTDIEVLDIIKGQRLYPTCSSLPDLKGKHSASDPGNCIRVVWSRSRAQDLQFAQDTLEYNEWGPSHMSINNEYFLLLDHILQATNGDSLSWNIKPTIYGQNTGRYWRLPITNGLVHDEKNRFGFGYYTPTNEFKSNIRSLINSFLGQ